MRRFKTDTHFMANPLAIKVQLTHPKKKCQCSNLMLQIILHLKHNLLYLSLANKRSWVSKTTHASVPLEEALMVKWYYAKINRITRIMQ